MKRSLLLAIFFVTFVIVRSGWTSSSILDKRMVSPIVGGSKIDIVKVPYQISMRYNDRHECGGSIYSDHVVVTAAHCLVRYPNVRGWSIVAGSSTLVPIGEHGQKILVARYIIHSNYKKRNYDFDVAIMILKGQFQFNEYVQPIPLTIEAPEVGSHSLISGWGYLSEGKKITPNQLRGAEVEIFPLSRCKRTYLNYTTNRMICAGVVGGGIDSCKGDSGGPMVVNGKLVGIISSGFGCGKSTHPGLYSNVAVLHSWISETIRNNSINLA